MNSLFNMAEARESVDTEERHLHLPFHTHCTCRHWCTGLCKVIPQHLTLPCTATRRPTCVNEIPSRHGQARPGKAKQRHKRLLMAHGRLPQRVQQPSPCRAELRPSLNVNAPPSSLRPPLQIAQGHISIATRFRTCLEENSRNQVKEKAHTHVSDLLLRSSRCSF